MTSREASCSCGQLRVRCEGDPLRHSLCHCLECQKRTGSLFGVAMFFSRANVAISGDSTVYTRGSDDGFAAAFHFCPTCGSTVYWVSERMPERLGVAVGAFADPTIPAPEKSVYNERRHHWFPELPQIKQHDV